MPKDRDDELNKGTSGDGFSLEEIMAEFGSGRKEKKPQWAEDTIPFPVVPKSAWKSAPRTGPGKVVSFPGGQTEQSSKAEQPPKAAQPVRKPAPAPKREAPPPKKEPDPPPPEEPEESKVVEFPGEEGPASDNPIAEGLNRLLRKADDYAGHMFEEEGKEDDENVRRAEEFIPGTDEEEPPETRRERRPRRQPPPAPDLPPADLARRYGKGIKGLKVRTAMVFLLLLPALWLTLDILPYPPVLTPERRVLALAGTQVIVMLLGLDVLFKGLLRLLRLELGMDTMLVFACSATLADALTLYSLDPRGGQMPYCAASILGIFCLLLGTQRKRRAQRLACRTAASAHQPYLVTLDEGKWNGRDTYAKWSGEPIGFGRQMQASDGAERIFHRICPLLFIACLLLSLVASVGRGAPERLLWCLSAPLTASTSLSGALCYGLPWLSLTQRLSRSGAAIAGWDGVTSTGSGCGILLNDLDLFPPGCVSLNGIKVFGDFPVEKVVANTATLIRDSGSGLDKIFHDLLRSQGAVYRRASGFCCYEGGLSAVIRDQQVLVGSAAFMQLMEIGLPQGLNVKNAVFCAIDGELAGIFALNYTLHGALEPSLHSLIRNRVSPVLATRDFNLIPSMLRQRFKLPVDKMEFPAVERRVELSQEEQPHSDILTAVLCREGLAPYAEAVVGAARLRRAVRLSAILACLGATAGLLLAFYLTALGAWDSLTAGNLLIFLVMWLVPTPLISGLVNKY